MKNKNLRQGLLVFVVSILSISVLSFKFYLIDNGKVEIFLIKIIMYVSDSDTANKKIKKQTVEEPTKKHIDYIYDPNIKINEEKLKEKIK